jgi:HEPN domain-containing protein
MSEAYLREWTRKAEEDYIAAITLARLRKQPTPSTVSFHCQQCAEKYLKAFLVQQGDLIQRGRGKATQYEALPK